MHLRTSLKAFCPVLLIIFTKSSILFKVGIGKSLFIDFALFMSIFNVVMMASLGHPLDPFSDHSK